MKKISIVIPMYNEQEVAEICYQRKGESIFKTFTAKMFYKILYNLSDVEIPKDTGDFRLADRKVIDVINSLPEHNKRENKRWKN